ncbi:hypothetical protein [Fluviicola taffensis]|nr:hypothetical protein [Fluviicola taffensis]
MSRSKRKRAEVHQQETMKIMDRISEIKNKHPELIKYLNEMPQFPTSANDSEIRLKDLMQYHNSLLELLEKYELESSTHSE